MKAYGITPSLVGSAVHAVSDDSYSGNLFAAELTNVSIRRESRATFVLRCHDSSGPGARRSAKGRRLIAATWAAHRDVIRALFGYGATRVTSALADYRSLDDFEANHGDTYYAKAGPPIAPVAFGDL